MTTKNTENQTIIRTYTGSKPLTNNVIRTVFDIEKYERFYGGETKKIVHYWYVTSTNYKWNVHELDLGNSMHLELSYTYKSEADNPKIDKYLMDSIAGSVKIR